MASWDHDTVSCETNKHCFAFHHIDCQMDLQFVSYDPLAESFAKSKKKKKGSAPVPEPGLSATPLTTLTGDSVSGSTRVLPDGTVPSACSAAPSTSTTHTSSTSLPRGPTPDATVSATTAAASTPSTPATPAVSNPVQTSTPAVTSSGNDDDEEEDGWQDADEDDDDDEDEDDDIPLDKPGVSSWRKRNPDLPVIPLRRGRKKQTAETRATAALKRAANKRKSLNFQADIDAINEARNKLAAEVAEKHGVKVDVVLRRLMAKSSFKATRKVNLFNAKVHYLCKKAKKMGKSLGWAEAKRKALDHPEFQNLTQLEEWALRAGLAADREKKEKGTRATNNAARADGNFTMAMMAEEITSLAQRTGMLGFAIFSRGHIHDKTVPTQIQSMGALNFCTEILGITAQDLALKSELWCVARERGLTGADTLQSMRKTVNHGIGTGLATTTGKKKIRMNYAQYWKRIVLAHGVILKGWPLDGGVVNPANIHNVESMQTLRDALQAGECYWHKMTSNEKEKAKERYTEIEVVVMR
ncbi:hypothetical protein C8F04DRAFT_1279915 [Mycena alexandri]|uniref:Uncharacterized protein n=1 Tax=Mycena alexandri TaxID=1745969 RepID=A0AAD6S1G8_9AGAR|nr:hypothetical protein C8F04DRAFT_1279915 [Mycena alexandri]